MLKATDDYQELLRISVCGPGNDHRLGASEAPPAIVSMYFGDELTGLLDAIEHDRICDTREKELFKVGVHALPRFPKDTSDRNRTSPFAFTGNKFEFRMLGSSASISTPNIVLNTAMAEELREFADELEGAGGFDEALHELIKRTIHEHRRIIFNGNSYSSQWEVQAAARGLANLRSTPECLGAFLSEKNVALFTEHRVLSEAELRSRCGIMLENYSKVTAIEAMTMADMVSKEILPAVSGYAGRLAETAVRKRQFLPGADCAFEEETVARLSAGAADGYYLMKELEASIADAARVSDPMEQGLFYREKVLPLMASLRAVCDRLESYCSEEVWPFPTYGELLFGVR